MQVVIYGNGAMARTLFSYARHTMDVCGFTVDAVCIAEGETTFCGLPLVPFTAVQERFAPDACRMIIAVGYQEMNELRERKYLEAKEKGYTFASYVHPSFFRHDDVTIGENCIIYDYVSIHPGCQIGHSTFISSNVNLGHDCVVGPGTWINGGVMLAGGCRIGAGCFFGVNASVAHGVAVGARNFIAANTLINRETKDDEVYLSEAGQLFRLKSKSFLKFAGI